MLFSQRAGISPVRTKIQLESMDDELRIGIWNVLIDFYWRRYGDPRLGAPLRIDPQMRILIARIWGLWYKEPFDEMPLSWQLVHERLKADFFKCEWWQVFDLLEFIVANQTEELRDQDFTVTCNKVLERELSAYRLVGEKIVPITTEDEISEIEEALKLPKPPVQEHLGRALQLLSDRKAPDYRNSIKESISAVESLCNLIAGGKRATLGQQLKIIESKVGLHPALKSAFTQLYGYTSDANGIRHALMEQDDLAFEDAKFMLVSCSAFVNYLVSKASNLGLEL